MNMYLLSLSIFLISTAYATSETVKIIGGHDTDITLHPWQISLHNADVHVCGGSLITDNWVATAAHCVDNQPIKQLEIKVGSTFLSSGGETYPVNKVIIHPGWAWFDNGNQNDIALLQLSEPVNHPNASTISLPDQDESLTPGINVSVTGWGFTSPTNRQNSEILQEALIPLVSHEDCQHAFIYQNITDTMLCLGVLGIGGIASCQNDSGGPAVVDNKLFGIVSWSFGCAQPNYPGVYTNVASYVNWIRTNIEL